MASQSRDQLYEVMFEHFDIPVGQLLYTSSHHIRASVLTCACRRQTLTVQSTGMLSLYATGRSTGVGMYSPRTMTRPVRCSCK